MLLNGLCGILNNCHHKFPLYTLVSGIKLRSNINTVKLADDYGGSREKKGRSPTVILTNVALSTMNWTR